MQKEAQIMSFVEIEAKSIFLKELLNLPSIEIKTDVLSLGIYATDASLYQLQPIAICVPASERELQQIVSLANTYSIPILPRGSATSLAGQTVNHALIIDFTKYFDKIITINAEERYAVVQPGVVRDSLNTECKQYGLHFAPDPATTSRATIGGMIANNSSGTKSIKYGKTIDHIIALKVLLMDGTILVMKKMSPQEWEVKCQEQSREGTIYKQFRSLIYQHTEAIRQAYPEVMRRVQGYALDEYTEVLDWNLAKVFSGSEGSLGIILEATINLEPIPQFKAAVTVHYADRLQAISNVKPIVDFEPAAIEMLDYNVFKQSKKNKLTKALHDQLIIGKPEATLSVEFFCLSQEELDKKLEQFLEYIRNEGSAYAYPVLTTPQELEASWSLRKNGLGLLMGDPSGRKPIPFIEDMAIPLDHLSNYIKDVLQLCDEKGVETILYAHASVGVLHVRPALDMTKQADILLMKEISDHVFTLVKKYKGAWSGEHGDGRNRGHRLKDYFGEEVYQCLKEIKSIFDPKYLMNPGIIIDVPPMDHHLRYGAGYTDQSYDFVYKYRKDHSFNALVHNCSGVGACRNHVGGTMCPSFRATENEIDSTRGRANALRLGISGQLGFTSLTDEKVLETLDLCLSCKACKSECPSNVDMAKLKSEVLQKKYDSGKITWREKAISMNTKLVKQMTGWKAPFINKIQSTPLFKIIAEKVLHLDRRRTLPNYAKETLVDWYKQQPRRFGFQSTVCLFADTYINYHEPQVGKAAIQLLNDCGYEVELLSVGCCQRPQISNGFLREAKTSGTIMVNQLKPYLDKGIPILVCEPSCTSALLDDLPDLLEDELLAEKLAANVYSIDIFLATEWKNGKIKGRFEAISNTILLHGHCHQKSSFGTAGMKEIYKDIEGLIYKEPDSGCCGMAGSFGYEKEHYDVSKKIADLVLVPTITQSNASTLVVASGFSCRHQINDFANRKAIHWVQSVKFMPNKQQHRK